MGRNGAGKSTLLRLAAGLTSRRAGASRAPGASRCCSRTPATTCSHERVGDELPAAALEAAGLGALADRHPRDLSGGERQRLALAIVLPGEPPAAVLLDEPTRGMDRGHKGELAARLRELAAAGAAVLVATHDAEFAAALRRPRRPARRRRAGRRRPDRRGARRRLVLRHPDRPHPRRARAAARGGRRAAARAGAAAPEEVAP